MTYDPFQRGPYPAGVCSQVQHDVSRGDRAVELEVWYPAAAEHAGHDTAPAQQDRYSIFGAGLVAQDAVRDAAPAAGAFPLVVFSHGMAGHRRQSTFFCSHLASHGYVVVSPDHGGNTITDLIALALRVREHEIATNIEPLIQGYVSDRPRDVALILDGIESGTLATPARVDSSRIAISGHSFGGFTALVVAARDARVRAVLALAPAGGAGPLASPALSNALTLDFQGRTVDTLYLALERDTLLPLSGIRQLAARTPPPVRMFTLPAADHMHFCDRAEASHEFFRKMPRLGIFGALMATIPPFAELVPGEHGYAFANALGLAHLDASLRGDRAAEDFLAQHAVAAFAARGIAITQP